MFWYFAVVEIFIKNMYFHMWMLVFRLIRDLSWNTRSLISHCSINFRSRLSGSVTLHADINHSAADCLRRQAKWPHLHDVPSFKLIAWSMVSTSCVTHCRVLVCFCSARLSTACVVMYQASWSDHGDPSLTAKKKIYKMYSLSISVGGYKKCLLSSVSEPERNQHVRGVSAV